MITLTRGNLLEAGTEALVNTVNTVGVMGKGIALQARQRFERVAALIEGYESPYGLELLASVHWVAKADEPPARDPAAASAVIRTWTARKASLFGPDHVTLAWQRLAEEGWLAA